MSQSRTHSLIETFAGVAIGFVVSVALSIIVYPLFGHAFTLGQNMGITLIFTIASIVRGYLVRRAFNRLAGRA